MNPELFEFLYELTGGNPGATQVCMALIADDEGGECGIVLSMMKSLNLRGPEIWTLFKDECESDIRKFQRAVIMRSADELMRRKPIADG